MSTKPFFSRNRKVALLFFIALSFLTYWKLFFHFYEQDEWVGLGHVFVKGLGRVTEGGNLFEVFALGSGRPVAGFLNYIFFSLFKLNTVPIAAFSILVHGITIFLVFMLLEKINPESKFNVLASVFFGINFASIQAITWFSSVAVPVSTAFLLISILLYMKFIEKLKRRNLYLSYLFFYVSFLTKELNFLFSFLFVLYFYLKKSKNLKRNLTLNLPYIAIMLLAFIRYISFFLFSKERVGLVISNQNDGLIRIVSNFVDVPLTSLSQVFLIPSSTYSLANKVTSVLYNRVGDDLFNQTIMSTRLSIIFSLVFIAIILILFLKNKLNKENLLFGSLFYLVSILPYVVVEKSFSFLEGRYYYLTVVGVAIIIAGMKLIGKNKLRNNLVYIFFLSYIFIQYRNINMFLNQKVSMSSQRKEIVQTLNQVNLEGKKINIFFSESEKDYLYEGQKLPFQQGIGYTLMVIYYLHGVIPDKFLTENYLWGITTEGYYSEGDYGFGYFYDPDKLNGVLETLEGRSYNLVYLKYDGKNLRVEKQIN